MKLLVPEKASRSVGSYRTLDTAIPFRMNAGFPGDVNRAHPASIQPSLISPVNPVTAYGQPVIIDTAGGANGGVRPFTAGDVAVTELWGVTVRPYPIQQSTTNQNYGAIGYGAGAPPLLQPVDVLRGGYVMVSVNGQPARGGSVWVWCAASGGGHIQGGFEVANSAGNTAALDANYQWNSPADTTGVAELICSKF